MSPPLRCLRPLQTSGKGRLAKRRLRLYLEQDGLCFYCHAVMTFHSQVRDPGGRRITTDHLVPLSKGGRYRYSNEVAACYACNNTRGDADWWTFYQAKATERGETALIPPRSGVND